MNRWRAIALAGTVLLGLGVILVAVAPDALTAFWRGSFGTRSGFLSGTLVRAIPLALIGAGLSIAFRAGAFNIGGEGQLILGAVIGALIGLNAGALGLATLPIALLAAAGAGAAWAGIAGVLRARFGVLEVISTIMLNFVAMNLVAYLVRGPMQEGTRIYPQSETLGAVARLPRLGDDLRLHAGLFIALAVCVAAWWIMERSALGFRLRATGASPDAARVAGRVNVTRTALLSMVLSGSLAGLAGGIEVTGVTYALYENISPGYGFSGIAVAVLARLNPVAVMPSALVFAALQTGALGMQRDAAIPSTVAAVLEAIAILMVVALHGWFGDGTFGRSRAPAGART